MKMYRSVQSGQYESPNCVIAPVEVQGVLCASTSYGSSSEGFDSNEDDYNWGA